MTEQLQARARPGSLGCWLAGACLIALVFAVYGQVGGLGFVSLDDERYVYANARVRDGLTWAGLSWAFSTFHAANWHPLTWLSHMLDVQLFGLEPGWHHVVNALIHAANAVILLLLLRTMTGALGRSAFVAAFFAVHPLHVESVAWIAERKDVLSTFFWLLTTAAYVSYARRGGPKRLALCVAVFAFGLLSKPMLVTLPLVLLLLDLWPLRRVSLPLPSASSLVPFLREKVPLFALAAASALVTWLAQARWGAVVSLEEVPVGTRLANAAVAYATYLLRAVWPAGLAAYYPHPTALRWPEVALSALALGALSALAIRQWPRRPYLAVGWLWYLVALLPVIGLVQVGLHAMADRYTYIPLVGPFVAAVWGGWDLASQGPRWRRAMVAAGASLALAWAVVARAQVGYWRDDFTLYQRALSVTEDNWMAWRGLGHAYFRNRQPLKALDAFREALRIQPRYRKSWLDLGVVYGALDDHPSAIQAVQEALRIDPRDAEAWTRLGAHHGALGQHALAAECFEQALAVDPSHGDAWFDLGVASAHLGHMERALEAYNRLRHGDPGRARRLAQVIREVAPPRPDDSGHRR